MNIGIIGFGVVGEAIYETMKKYHPSVVAYDIDPQRSKNGINDVFKSDAIFLAVPTPLNNQNRLNTSIISEYLKKLEERKYKGLIIIKSTLPLNYLKTAREHELRVLYSPEFLHEKTAKDEMMNPPYVVCSGLKEDFDELIKILYWVPTQKFHLVDDRTAELTKLALNAFAATKISFVNEIERICHIQGAQEEKVMEILRLDKRCSDEYAYPNRGPYQGMCLPKDTVELKNSTPGTILFEAIEKVNERTKQHYNKGKTK